MNQRCALQVLFFRVMVDLIGFGTTRSEEKT